MTLDFEKPVKSELEQATEECVLTIGMNLKAAIEKQIPKRIEEKRYIYTKCECGREFSVHHGDGYYSIPYENKTNYCPDCGQKLDWESEE